MTVITRPGVLLHGLSNCRVDRHKTRSLCQFGRACRSLNSVLERDDLNAQRVALDLKPVYGVLFAQFDKFACGLVPKFRAQ
jgi:hypothetical protein